MLLPFTADQATYDKWHEIQMERVNAPGNEFMMADLNDGIFVFMTARTLGQKYPEKLDAFIEHVPEAVENAMGELGMFMGVTALAKAVGLDGEEAREVGISLLRQSVQLRD